MIVFIASPSSLVRQLTDVIRVGFTNTCLFPTNSATHSPCIWNSIKILVNCKFKILNLSNNIVRNISVKYLQ